MTGTTTPSTERAVAAAAAPRAAASVAIDTALGAIAVAGAIALGTSSGAPGWVLAAIVLLALVGAWWWGRATLGSSPGHLALGLRSVDALTGMPGPPVRRDRQTVDVRRGPDPLRLVAQPVELAAATTTGLASPAVAGLALVLDDGSRHVIRRRTVVGRDPSPTAVPGVDARVAIPDLSRSIARAHLVVEVDGDDVVVTDLGDPGGTLVVDADDGEGRRIAAGVPERLAFGTVLRLGSRTIALRRRTDLAEPA